MPHASAQDTGDYVLSDWWWRSPVLDYRVNLNGAPPGALDAIRSAADTWNAAPGTQVELRYAGLTNVATSAADGVNAIYWGQLSGALGRAGTQLQIECQTICETEPIDFDILISQTASITVGALGTQNFDLESLVLHEFGHALGLGHADLGQVMFGILTSGTEVRTLASGDRAAVQVRYPPADGDVNCDGRLNILDAYALSQFSVDIRRDVGRCPPNASHNGSSVFALMGDGNRDGSVNIADAYAVARCAVNIPGPLCPNG